MSVPPPVTKPSEGSTTAKTVFVDPMKKLPPTEIFTLYTFTGRPEKLHDTVSMVAGVEELGVPLFAMHGAGVAVPDTTGVSVKVTGTASVASPGASSVPS